MRRMMLVLAAVGLGLSPGCGGGGGSDGASPVEMGSSAAVFNENEFNDVALTLSEADWLSIINDTMGDQWREATFQWKNVVLQRVAVRPHGEWTRQPGNQKQSMVLKFDEFVPGQTLHGLRKVRLDGLSRDPSMMRDRLSYGVFRARMPAPRAVHCRLFVNGEYRGVYEIEESLDDVFVLGRFGGDLGDLYRIRISEVDPYLWVGSDPNDYIPFPWEPKTNERTFKFTQVVHYLDVLNHDPANFAAVCNVEAMLDYLAVEAAISDADGAAGEFGSNNHFQYGRTDTGQFQVIPWDPDSTWWDDPPVRSIFQNFQRSPLTALFENDAALRSLYKQRIGQVIAAEMQPEAIKARIDLIYEQIRDAAHADPYKMFTNLEFDDSWQFLRRYADERCANLQEQIALP